MHNVMFSHKVVINRHNIFVLLYLQFSPSVDEEVKVKGQAYYDFVSLATV